MRLRVMLPLIRRDEAEQNRAQAGRRYPCSWPPDPIGSTRPHPACQLATPMFSWLLTMIDGANRHGAELGPSDVPRILHVLRAGLDLRETSDKRSEGLEN